jgi:hypothetical protein
MNATITWSAFYMPNGSYSLRGSIADAQSGTFVGYIYAGLNINTANNTVTLNKHGVRISRNGVDAIKAEDQPSPTDYWGSLASCSNVSVAAAAHGGA